MNYNDVFNEQLVAKKNTMIDNLKRGGVILLGLLIILAVSLFLPAITPFVAVAVVWGGFIIMKRLNVEYEYAFTNGELDIDKIFSKSSRKHAFTVDIRSFVVMIQVNNPNFKSEIGNINETKDFSTGEVTDSTYAAVYEHDGKRIKLLIDPNEQLLKAMKMYIPRKIK